MPPGQEARPSSFGRETAWQSGPRAHPGSQRRMRNRDQNLRQKNHRKQSPAKFMVTAGPRQTTRGFHPSPYGFWSLFAKNAGPVKRPARGMACFPLGLVVGKDRPRRPRKPKSRGPGRRASEGALREKEARTMLHGRVGASCVTAKSLEVVYFFGI